MVTLARRSGCEMRKFMRTRSAAAGGAGGANGHAGGRGSNSSDDDDTEAERGAGEDAGDGWEDPEFPATARALGSWLRAPTVRWMRPHELSARPTFLGAESERDEGGARWAAREAGAARAVGAAAAALAGAAPRLLARALPPRSGVDSARPYVFRLWVFGEWREVCVDDRVPARCRRPLARSRLPHDYTLPLLVKACAKVAGSYAGVSRDRLPDALRRLTGGVVQAARGPAAPRLLAAAAPRATIALALAPRLPPHLLLPSAPHLLHLRSVFPHPPHVSDRWISPEELSATFAEVVVVHVPPDEWATEPALRARRPWRAVVARRAWRPGVNAGGSPHSYPDTADANPQFQMEVGQGGSCHVVVSVVQRAQPAAAVGLAVYAVDAGRAGGGRAPLGALRALEAVGGPARELALWLRLAAGGRYAVVPHARRPHAAGQFLLRVLADDRLAVWECNEENAVPRPLRAELAALAAAGAGRAVRRGEGEDEARWAPGAAGALLAARDGALAGALGAGEAARLAALAARWRAAWGGARRRPALRLRALLARVGVSVSNKVLDALVARFARDARSLSRADYVHALAVLYLAHERHRLLDAKIKSNPISLEEVRPHLPTSRLVLLCSTPAMLDSRYARLPLCSDSRIPI